MTIRPVLVLNSGRCGSTMLSDIFNSHPRILSLSEFFASVHPRQWRRHTERSGDQMWRVYSKPTIYSRRAAALRPGELLYPFGRSGGRYTHRTAPPIQLVSLPHLTDRHDELFDELGSVVRAQPRQPPEAHFRFLFSWLCERFGADVWVERSGASLMFATPLLRTFPDARVIHLHRDGRDTAMSMCRHRVFAGLARFRKHIESMGVDSVDLYSSQELTPWTRLRLTLALSMTVLRLRKAGRPRLTEFGGLWNAMMQASERILDDIPHDRLLHVGYEDVLARPHEQIRRIVRFIDPTLEDRGWLRGAASIPRPPSAPKHERLGAAELAALTEACRPSLERLGYLP